jgi:ribosomal protein S18 acetylase RimI-like enzyme
VERTDLAHEITYSAVTSEDLATLPELMLRAQIPLANLIDLRLYRTFVSDALRQQGPHIMLVRKQGKIIGWSIAIIDSRSYWLHFIYRHLPMGLRIVHTYCKRRIVQIRQCVKVKPIAFVSDGCADHAIPLDVNAWGKGGPHTAKLLNTTILPFFRGQSLAEMLQWHHLSELCRLGIRRVEAYVNKDNKRWNYFNARKGFRFVAVRGPCLLMVQDLHQPIPPGPTDISRDQPCLNDSDQQ